MEKKTHFPTTRAIKAGLQGSKVIARIIAKKETHNIVQGTDPCMLMRKKMRILANAFTFFPKGLEDAAS